MSVAVTAKAGEVPAGTVKAGSAALFPWSWYSTPALVDDLVRDARLRRLDGYVTADLH